MKCSACHSLSLLNPLQRVYSKLVSTGKFIARKAAPAFVRQMVLIRPAGGHGEPGAPGRSAGWVTALGGPWAPVGAACWCERPFRGPRQRSRGGDRQGCRGRASAKEGGRELEQEQAAGEGSRSQLWSPTQAGSRWDWWRQGSLPKQLPATLWRCMVHLLLSLSRVSSKTEARLSPVCEGSGRQNHQGRSQEAASCPGKACPLLRSEELPPGLRVRGAGLPWALATLLPDHRAGLFPPASLCAWLGQGAQMKGGCWLRLGMSVRGKGTSLSRVRAGGGSPGPCSSRSSDAKPDNCEAKEGIFDTVQRAFCFCPVCWRACAPWAWAAGWPGRRGQAGRGRAGGCGVWDPRTGAGGSGLCKWAEAPGLGGPLP